MLKTVSTISGFVSPTFTGDVTLENGNLVIGTSGKGIDFSATPGTGTSELLNDYEEGTWTPNQGAGLTVVGSFSSEGTYTKIGRVVTLFGRLNGSTSISTSATTAVICSNPPWGSAKEQDGNAHTASYTTGYGTLISVSNIYALPIIPSSGSIWFTITYMI